jgi:hypothetical protein
MSTKFEQLLDLLVNEEMDKANELFHEIVVEKSREIYENMIAEEEKDDDMEEAAEESDESVEEAAEDDDMEESVEEEDNMDESEELEDSYMMDADDAEDDGEMGGDAADDMLGDVEVDGGDDSDKSEDEAIMDIKNAIAELEAAFADLEAAQGGDMGSDMGMDSEFGDEEDGEDSDEKDEMMGMVREYRETVSKPSGDVAGANTGDKMSAAGATKSPISSGSGKPTTGADSKNILAKGATSNEDGTSPKGKVGGLVKSGGEFTKGVEKNIAGSANAKMKSGSDLSKQGAGYPGNNKTAGPVGSGKGDKAGQTSVHNTPSPLNGAPNRNA